VGIPGGGVICTLVEGYVDTMEVKVLRLRDSWAWAVAWHPVFGINLIVPLVLASGVLEGRGQVGMYCGIAFYWVLGFMTCASRPSLGRVLVTGGVIIACTQLMPVLQFTAGFAAVMIGHQVEEKSPEVCGFIDVIITGGLLLIAAYCSGRFWVSFENWAMGPPRSPSSPDVSL
jgi:hypothetical protein